MGAKGRSYIGLSSLTKKGLIKKLGKLNEYFNIEFVASTGAIDNIEAIRQNKRLGGF